MVDKDALSQGVGGRVRKLRVERGLSLRKLAKLTGIAYSNLSKFENGAHDPKLSTIARIAEALGVQMTSLIEEEESC
jgi:transcriptional regulator with XRE-family HTH domain